MAAIDDIEIPSLLLAEQGSNPTTPASGFGRLFAKADGLYFIDDAGTVTGPFGGSGPNGLTFKRTVISGTGDISVTSASRTALDATDLAYLTLAGLAVGDVVECSLSIGGAYVSSFGIAFDFEVDRPTSADTYVAPNNDRGCGMHEATARMSAHIVGLFTVTEAGDHGFRPAAWMPNGGTGTVANAASGANASSITFMVKKLGAPAS